MIIRRQTRSTLAAVEMQYGDTLEFRPRDGRIVAIESLGTGAKIVETTL